MVEQLLHNTQVQSCNLKTVLKTPQQGINAQLFYSQPYLSLN